MKKEPKNETYAKLRKALPHGFSRIVVERLAARGIKVSVRSVQLVANGAFNNPHIQAELLEILKNPPEKESKKSDFEIEVEKVLAERRIE